MSEATAPSLREGAKTRILIVDDDKTMAAFCARSLTIVGYTAVAVNDAAAGIQTLMNDGPFDLLLTDVQMPGKSGIELAQIAREYDPSLAIIIMTGHTNLDTLHAAARQGVANFLSKPFEIDALQLAVSQALHQRDLLQEQLRLRALERLLQSSKALNETLDYAALIQVFLYEIRRILNAGVTVFIEPDGSHSEQRVFSEPAAITLSDDGRIAVQHSSENSGIRIVDPTRALVIRAETALYGGLIAALHAGGAYLGSVIICDGEHLHRPDHIDMLTVLINQAAPSLRNARMYRELERTYRGLAELDRLKSEFISIASHELRTPLALVIGYTRMIRDRGGEDSREYAQRALDGAEKMSRIVNEMTNLHQNDTQQDELHYQWNELHELVQQAIERFAAAATARKHVVSFEPATPIKVKADREKLQLIIGNLVQNAITFTPEQGKIIISTTIEPHQQVFESAKNAATNPSLRRLRSQNPSKWAVITVRDNGIGIPTEHQSRIFERFYQVAGSLTRNHGGVGLGLALVAEMVKQHQGMVWVESNANQGSCFRVALPLPEAIAA